MSTREFEKARDDIVSRLNILEYYTSNGFVVITDSGGQATGKCIFHDDNSPSFSINTKNGLFKCFNPSCVASNGGSIFDFEMMVSKCNYLTALGNIGKAVGIEIKGRMLPPIEHHVYMNFHEELFKAENRAILDEFILKRGLTEETIKRFKIGFCKTEGPYNKRYTIPIFDEDGNCRNIRYYLMGASDFKMLNHKVKIDANREIKFGIMRLFNIADLNLVKKDEDLIICEGELDACILSQQGFRVVTATAGAGSFPKNDIEKFKDLNVIFLFDNDDAGREAASKLAFEFHKKEIPTRIAKWPSEIGNKGDATDYFVKLLKTRQELIDEVISKAREFVPEEQLIKNEIAEGNFTEISLHQSNEKDHIGKRVAVKCIISGMNLTPFIVPKRVVLSCDQGRGETCLKCGMLLKGGSSEVLFTAKEKQTIALTNTSDSKIKALLRSKVGAIECPRLKYENEDMQKIEEVILIPLVREFSDDGAKYTQKICYVVDAKNLESNKSYELNGYAVTNPNNQYATILFDHVQSTQDDIESFNLTLDMEERLKKFQPETWDVKSVEKKFEDICTDFEYNVHSIYDRHEVQIAYDLTFHSVLSFHFNSAKVDKGWVECLAIGDSSQGKSDILKMLMRHYKVGEKISGENMTLAGLIGGVEKFGERWIMTWGKFPLNDKRLLGIEELTGLDKEILAKVTDVRSSGLAEVTKIRKEVTLARVRLILTANARSKRPINTFNYGVEAVMELFGAPEDVRRLDLAVTVASGEIDPEVYNKKKASREKVEHKYLSEECKNLILWAWSRNATQVEFEAGAEDFILDCAKLMSQKYSARIPLVEPADQRIKLARLSVAAAARTFSINGNPHVIYVRKCHVAFVYNYLNKIYDKKSMGYDVYSKQQNVGVNLSEERLFEIERDLKLIPNFAILGGHLLSLNRFRKGDIGDLMGYSSDELKVVFKRLSFLGCIKSTPAGFVKMPFFTKILKDSEFELINEEIVFNGNGNHKEVKKEEIDFSERTPAPSESEELF